ncbi:MAG: hypothetical protein K5917_04535 [Clostridiales bacterium]|nr:hypothetical protein [Clostridiales bacterium]
MKKLLKSYMIILFICIVSVMSFCAFTLARENTSKMIFSSSYNEISIFSDKPVMAVLGNKLYKVTEKEEKIIEKGTMALRTFLPAPINAVVFIAQRTAFIVKAYL